MKELFCYLHICNQHMQCWLLLSAFNLDLFFNLGDNAGKKRNRTNKRIHNGVKTSPTFHRCGLVLTDWELWKRQKRRKKEKITMPTEGFFLFFFFPWDPVPVKHCSDEVCRGLNGRKMGQERASDCAVSQRNPTSAMRAAPWRPAAEFSLHSPAPYIHWKTPWMRNNSITGLLTSVFISPACRKDGMEGRGEKKKSSERHYGKGSGNVWYAVGLWRWSVKSNVCVCDKTGMSLSSGGKCGRKGADLPA